MLCNLFGVLFTFELALVGKIIQVTQILLATILKILRMKAVPLAGEPLLQLWCQRNPLKQLTAPDTRVVAFFNILFLNIYRVWGFIYLFIPPPHLPFQVCF